MSNGVVYVAMLRHQIDQTDEGSSERAEVMLGQDESASSVERGRTSAEIESFVR